MSRRIHTIALFLKTCALPLEAPVRRKAARERMTPKTSWERIEWTFPVVVSGLSNSILETWETMSSCCLVPEKFPRMAWLMALGACKVRLYRNMVGNGSSLGVGSLLVLV